MFFVPVAILVIEDEDDRTFMENLYSSYHRLMYHTIHLITEDPWITEDILQSTTEKLIQNLDTIKHLPQPKFLFISILLDAVMKLLQHASITFCKYETDPILIFEATHL